MATSSTQSLTSIAIASADEGALARLRRAAQSLDGFVITRLLRSAAALQSFSSDVDILAIAGPAELAVDRELAYDATPHLAYFFVLLEEQDYAIVAGVSEQPRDLPVICSVADSHESRLAVALAAAAEGLVVTETRDTDSGTDTDLPVLGNGAGPTPRLAPRETQVLELLASGFSNTEIAPKLGISENTVKFHLSSVYQKLGVSTRAEAVYRAVRLGLIPL